MRKKFEFEFEDQACDNSISFDYDESFDEKISVLIENGVPVIYANRSAFILLAKTLAKMALCDYSNGFHVHLYQDFNADEPEALRVILDETEETTNQS